MRLGLGGLLEVHIVYHRHQVEVDGGDEVFFRFHGQGGLHHACAFGIVLLQIEAVGQEIQSEIAQARGSREKKFQVGADPPASAKDTAVRTFGERCSASDRVCCTAFRSLSTCSFIGMTFRTDLLILLPELHSL